VQPADVATTLGWTAALLGIVYNVPQTWRSCAAREVAGLSPASRWLAVLQSATWLVYGLTGGGLVQVVTNAVNVVLHLAVLAALLLLAPQVRERRVLLPHLAGSAAWLAVVAWSVSSGTVSVGVLAAVCSVAYAVPQLVLLATDAGAAGGVSASTVVLGAASNACWTLYGLLLGTPAVWLPALLSLVAGLATAALLRPVPPPSFTARELALAA